MLASKKLINHEVITLALFFMLENIRGESTADNQAFIQAGLAEHNLYRARHQGTKPLQLDPNLNEKAEKCAQYYLELGEIDHSCTDKDVSEGENLYSNSRTGTTTPIDAVQAAKEATQVWYNEIYDYDFIKNRMKDGKDLRDIAHFTQLVWKDTKKLGMGRATAGGNTVVVSLYFPGGNFINNNGEPGKEYRENVRSLDVGGIKDYRMAALEIHNKFRALHKDTDPLELDGDLNLMAQKCAQYYVDNGGIIDHSCPHKGSGNDMPGENLYGGNLTFSGTLPDSPTAVTKAIEGWYDEIKHYDFDKNSWKEGKSLKDTGNFTQVVWKNSKKLGVGYADTKNDGKAVVAVTCLYSPAGNNRPEYKTNVGQLTSAADVLKPGKSQNEQLLYLLVLSAGLFAGENLLSIY